MRHIILGLFTSFIATTAHADTAVFAGGCFWCVESNFESVEGVNEVVSGFTGGEKDNPSYKDVTAGGSGHLEATTIDYNPDIVTYAELVDLFLRSTDVTDAGGQFCDRGESYRSAIFVANDAERQIAEAAISKAEKTLGQSIVTPVLKQKAFFPANEYHQNYYKSDAIVITRFGPRSKEKAYKLYRNACGRDERVKELWGNEAAFVH